MKTEWMFKAFPDKASTWECCVREYNRIVAELTTLAAEIAAKDEAILDGISNTYMLKEHCPGVYQEDAVAVEDIEAALSPPGGVKCR